MKTSGTDILQTQKEIRQTIATTVKVSRPIATRLCLEEGGSGGSLVTERRRKLRLGLVVTSETVDTRLDENETELGVYTLSRVTRLAVCTLVE